jgi:hypothetical protein
MSERSLATGVWIITHGHASRTITSNSGGGGQQQLTVETLVPGQSVGWEELTLQMRPDFVRQVLHPPLFPPFPSPPPPSPFPLLPARFVSSSIISRDERIAGIRHEHVQRCCYERCSHTICPGARNQGCVHQPGVFVCPSSVCPTCSHSLCSHVGFDMHFAEYVSSASVLLLRAITCIFFQFSARRDSCQASLSRAHGLAAPPARAALHVRAAFVVLPMSRDASTCFRSVASCGCR